MKAFGKIINNNKVNILRNGYERNDTRVQSPVETQYDFIVIFALA